MVHYFKFTIRNFNINCLTLKLIEKIGILSFSNNSIPTFRCSLFALYNSPGKKWLWSYGQKSGITSKMRMCHHHHHHSISGFCPVLMKNEEDATAIMTHESNCVKYIKCVLCYLHNKENWIPEAKFSNQDFASLRNAEFHYQQFMELTRHHKECFCELQFQISLSKISLFCLRILHLPHFTGNFSIYAFVNFHQIELIAK